MNNKNFKNKENEIIEKIYSYDLPFLTIGEFNDEEIVGILQNIKDNLIYIYLYDMIKSSVLKKRFLELGSKWWWESNRKVPINIFLGEEFLIFKNYLRIFNLKSFKIVYCPNLSFLNLKKSEKKNIIFKENDINK